MAIAAVNGNLAGGAISATGYLTLGGIAVVLQGDAVAPHPPWPPSVPHRAATTTASSHLTLNGIAVTVTGDPATCTHAAAGTSHLDLS